MRPLALRAEMTRGRRHPEAEHPYRDCFERDRDRVVHARAFRRLEYKTQVFPNYHGDHFRTRLTHTIEVAQLARTVARALGLNETLAEAIALAHDLGHPPFGHVGERTLDGLMAGVGGFEHNRHTLRTVDEIEHKYAAFRGLNLSYEVREGIAKHAARDGRYTERVRADFDPAERPPLEAQIIDLVDHVAYNVHDIDDGVEAHLLEAEQVAERVPLFGETYRRVGLETPGIEPRDRFNESVRQLIDLLVTDLIESSRAALASASIESVADVRRHPVRLVAHSPAIEEGLEALGEFLAASLYRHELVHEQMEECRRVLTELFESYVDDPGLLPPRHRRRIADAGACQVVGDYVAGMTDRFVMREHTRVFGSGPVDAGRVDGD